MDTENAEHPDAELDADDEKFLAELDQDQKDRKEIEAMSEEVWELEPEGADDESV